MGAGHGLPYRSRSVHWLIGSGIRRRGGQSLPAALASPPAEEAAQQCGVGVAVFHVLVLELQLQSCLIEGLFAAASEGFTGRFGREVGL